MTPIEDLEASGRELLLLLESAVYNGEQIQVALDKAFAAGRRLGQCEGFDRASAIVLEAR